MSACHSAEPNDYKGTARMDSFLLFMFSSNTDQYSVIANLSRNLALHPLVDRKTSKLLDSCLQVKDYMFIFENTTKDELSSSPTATWAPHIISALRAV